MSTECGAQCVLSVVIVGFVWGATNPMLRAASKSSAKSSDSEEKIIGIVGRFLKSFLDWRFSVPFLMNQSGSILFNALVVNFPVTLVVPLVNAIQFIATVIVGRIMGEKMESSSRRQTFGMLLATVAIIGMLCVD